MQTPPNTTSKRETKSEQVKPTSRIIGENVIVEYDDFGLLRLLPVRVPEWLPL